MPESRAASPQVELLRQIGPSIWIADGGAIEVAGSPLPVRMTVIRLANGELILHSPTAYSQEMRQALEAIGAIQYLLAPNIAHWTFVRAWQRALPHAQTVAVKGLAERSQVQLAGLRIDVELTDMLPEVWSNELEAIAVSAPPFFELALYHIASETLILTDLVQNIDARHLPPLSRLAATIMGVTAPSGRAPVYLRALLWAWQGRTRPAAERLVALAPQRVIFSHGIWFEEDATARLRQSLGWLLGSGALLHKRSSEMKGLRVVVTGASSGIGRATALAFAARGASVILAARRADVLHEGAQQSADLGGVALVCRTDVTDPAEVSRLVESAVNTFGGIDVWINNAGTGVFGPFERAEISLHRATLEVNLIGAVHGAHAVLPVFRRQGRGILINNISLGGWAPTPYAAAYTASKFGLRGFTASLRQEMGAHPGIRICAVFPSMVDTPGFIHGANVSGRNLDPGPFLYRAEDVAQTMIEMVRRPRDEVAVGWPARAGQISYVTMRGLTERLMSAALRALLARARPAPPSRGALLSPIAAGTSTAGGWLQRKGLPSAGVLTRVGIVAGIGLVLLARASKRRGRRAGGD